KKRTEKEKSAFIQFANKQFIMELLPVLDNFERAMQSTNDEGIKLIYNQLLEILKKHNVNEIDAIGKQFDPKLHEALLQEASDKEPNTVLEVLQKGYIVGDAVLRSAKVKVSKKNETGKV
ncbi:nucleotide exchange factor GrpE, partial [Candidatus Woesearchaeota archaeon CG10_big_fil_rev_8_21_14_0_10_34_8]